MRKNDLLFTKLKVHSRLDKNVTALNIDDAGDIHIFEFFAVLLGMYVQMITWGFLSNLNRRQSNETMVLE